MRLHQLTVQAFGPFAGEIEVDFDALSDAGLFLLTGPTGAGKTSILDAVCFGLYGVVPGERNNAKALHSHHAGRREAPRVELEVTVRARRLRLTRSPEWRRESSRAKSGSVKEQARVSLVEQINGEWVGLSTRLDEVGDLVRHLVGLTAGQFCQVVLLPQGQFQSFLRADAGERRKVLESIFATQRFDDITRWLVEHRRSVTAEHVNHMDALRNTVARVGEVIGAELEPTLLDDPTELLAELEQLRTAAHEDLSEARLRLQSSSLTAKQARHDLDSGCTTLERQESHREATAKLGDLETLAEVYTRQTGDVAAAREAKTLLPLLDLADSARLAFETADGGADTALGPLVARDLISLPTSVSELERLERSLGRRHTAAEEAARIESQRAALTARTVTIKAQASNQESSIDELRRVADALPERISALADLLVGAQTAAAQLTAKRDEVDRVSGVFEAARAVVEWTERLRGAEQVESRLREAATRHRTGWLDLRQLRLEGFAAELAAQLEVGTACPVCGSETHPSPAQTAGRQADQADEDAAQLALEHAEQLLREASLATAEVLSQLAGARASSLDLTAEIAGARLVTARASLRDAGTAAESAARLGDELAAAKNERHTNAVQTATAKEALAAVRQALTGTTSLLAEATELLHTQLGGSEDAAALLRGVQSDLLLVHTATTTQRTLDDQRSRRDDADEGLASAVAASRFASASDARSAVLTDTQIAETEALIRAYELDLKSTHARLTDLALLAAVEQPVPDIDLLTTRQSVAALAQETAAGAHAQALHRSSRLDELADECAGLLAAVEPVACRLAIASSVASLCSGTSADNALKAELSSYVLSARLEQVVGAANDRLGSISGGRYTLEHSMHKGVGDKRGGLGLRVVDGHTGVSRDPATLSGGETFFVSLALALGLADLVASEAGGAELSTLFVDEGFGSLDTDTLDEVMDELDSLRSGGRTVGLVSHLAELRQRVPAQLTVVKGRHGSTVDQ